MNDTALAFAGGVLCGIFVGAFLFAIFIFTVIQMAEKDKKNNNNNNDIENNNF